VTDDFSFVLVAIAVELDMCLEISGPRHEVHIHWFMPTAIMSIPKKFAICAGVDPEEVFASTQQASGVMNMSEPYTNSDATAARSGNLDQNVKPKIKQISAIHENGVFIPHSLAVS